MTSALSMFRANPMAPIISTSFGDSTTSRCAKRSMDCKKMDNARASRKTPLKKAPVETN